MWYFPSKVWFVVSFTFKLNFENKKNMEFICHTGILMIGATWFDLQILNILVNNFTIHSRIFKNNSLNIDQTMDNLIVKKGLNFEWDKIISKGITQNLEVE